MIMVEEYNPFSLKGKTILITGASSGIGKATAIECSKMGASIICVARNESRLSETMSQLATNNHHKALSVDLSNKSELAYLIDNIPQLDGIVLGAGIVDMMPMAFAKPDKIEKIYSTNLFAPIELLRLSIRKKKLNNPCSVVAITSIAGDQTINVGNGIYGSGKTALKSAMKYFAIENASKGIRVNTISPGYILTPMHTNGVVDEEQLNKEIEKVPVKKWGRSEDIAYAAIYLLSNTSLYITGADMVIDGGLTLI